MVLLAPVRLFLLQIGLWFGAAVVFGLLDSRYALQLGVYVATTVVITGMITAACAYLLTERVLRPAAVRALAGVRSEELAVPGVATRAVLAWGLGSGLLLLAVMAIGIGYLTGSPASPKQLAVAMVALSSIALAVGLLAVSLAARATAAPIDAVTSAMEAVERGQLDTRVRVYDSAQIGKLQQGFNDMLRGLVERDRIREIFGTYVDVDVAERVLQEGVPRRGGGGSDSHVHRCPRLHCLRRANLHRPQCSELSTSYSR